MAKASVTVRCHECGKEFAWSTIKSNRREANAWEAWAGGQERLCPECYAKAMREKREQERKDALAVAEESAANNNMAPLVGSEKQIAWAMQIREDAFRDLTEHATPVFRSAVIDCTNAHTEASWWIDNRTSSTSMIRKAAEELAVSMLPFDERKALADDARKHLAELEGELNTAITRMLRATYERILDMAKC